MSFLTEPTTLSQNQNNPTSFSITPPSFQSSPSFGSPPVSSTPLSIELETQTLTNYRDRLPYRSYMSAGYKNYLKWLSMTLGSSYAQHLNFCVARNINLEKQNAMGMDLEIRYLIKKLENLFGKSEMKHYGHIVKQTLKENLHLSDTHAMTVFDDYIRNPESFQLVLSDDDFSNRLSKIPIYDLDTHSFKVWRNEDHRKLNETSYPVSREDILNGEALAPPSAKHIGIQLLQMRGYLPHSKLNVRTPQHYGLTFI